MIIELDAKPSLLEKQCRRFRPLGHMFLDVDKDELTFAVHWPDLDAKFGRLTIPAEHVLVFLRWAEAQQRHPGDKEGWDWSLVNNCLMPLAPRLLDQDLMREAIATVESLSLRKACGHSHVDIHMSQSEVLKLSEEISKKKAGNPLTVAESVV